MEVNQIRKYYFAVLSEVAIAYNINKEDLHEILKVWYKIKSTTKLNYDWWYEYIENVLYFIMCIFNMYFDSTGYKIDNISYIWLYGTMKPDNRKKLF